MTIAPLPCSSICRPKARQHQNSAIDIDIHVKAPMLVAGVLGADIAFGDAGIVDENIDAAMLLRSTSAAALSTSFDLVTSSVTPLRLEAELLQFGDARLDPVGQHLGDDDCGARFAQRLRAGKADALTAACHHRHAARRVSISPCTFRYSSQLIQLPPSTLNVCATT